MVTFSKNERLFSVSTAQQVVVGQNTLVSIAVDVAEAAVAPWVGSHHEDQLRTKIIALSSVWMIAGPYPLSV